MTCQLLPWVLATLACAGSWNADDPPDDPYLWLEEVSGAKPMAWVKERNAESTGELTRTDGFRKLEHRLLEILDSDERIPTIQKVGPYYYNFWRDAKNRRGLWRRTSLEEYRKDKPAWEVVLDLDALASQEGENWVWHGAQALRPEYKVALISLSRGGADAAIVREFDLETKSFVRDGYSLPEAKSRIAWRGHDSVFVGTDFGPGSMTDSGYPRIVKEWKRGTPLADAAVVFEGKVADMGVGARGTSRPASNATSSSARRRSGPRRSSSAATGSSSRSRSPTTPGSTCIASGCCSTCASEWTVGGKTYPAGALIATDLEAFLKGARAFDVLFEPTERKTLSRYSPTRHHILLNELDNVRSRIEVLTHKDGRWTREPMPGLSEFVDASASAVDSEESDDYFLHSADFLTPDTLSLGTAGGGPAQRLKQLPALFNAEALAVSQHEAVSQDGTRIPYFQVAQRIWPSTARM